MRALRRMGRGAGCCVAVFVAICLGCRARNETGPGAAPQPPFMSAVAVPISPPADDAPPPEMVDGFDG